MEKLPEKKRSLFDLNMLGIVIIMLLGYVLIHDLFGGTLFSYNSWDSYTLQALSWREGRLDLGRNYEYLELAIFEGKYYVSFPPVPSVVVLPLTFIFGANVPSNFISALYGIITALLAYKVLRVVNMEKGAASLLAMLVVWGSNAMWMSTSGGVWFQAQLLNMLLLIAAVYCALTDKRKTAYALVALAVGCRPFSAVGFLVLFVYFYTRDKAKEGSKGFFKTALSQWSCFIIPMLIAGAYMWYNAARFNNPFEFGHNYLPEFLAAPQGQFNLSYIPQNLKNIFLNFITFGEGLKLEYSIFNGFIFFIANPIFIMLFVRILADTLKKRLDAVRIAAIAAIVLNLLLLCAHKTFGGWQFGACYTVDMIPLVLFYLAYGAKDLEPVDKDAVKNAQGCHVWPLKRYESLLCILAIMFNVYGALAMHFLYGS